MSIGVGIIGTGQIVAGEVFVNATSGYRVHIELVDRRHKLIQESINPKAK